MKPIGEVDDLEVLIGQRGTGKSTYMVHRARQLQRSYGGAYVLGHSLGRRLPSKIPAELGGGTVPLQYHLDLKEVQKGMRSHPDRWHILAPPLSLEMPAAYYRERFRETADDLIAYAVRLSTQLRMAAWRRENPWSLRRNIAKIDFTGVPCTPIILMIDEGVAVEGATQSKTKEEGREFKEWLFSLRHLHTALLWSIQDPTARGWHILGQATWLRIFHTKHEYALQAIRAAGAEEEDLDDIEDLYAYEHVDVRVGVEKRPESKAPPTTKPPTSQGEPPK